MVHNKLGLALVFILSLSIIAIQSDILVVGPWNTQSLEEQAICMKEKNYFHESGTSAHKIRPATPDP